MAPQQRQQGALLYILPVEFGDMQTAFVAL
jgi:hypothetical protein